MANQIKTYTIELPKWKWSPFLLLSLVPSIMGILSFFFPNILLNENKTLRLTIGVILLFSPLLIPLVIWLFKLCIQLIKRILTYNELNNYLGDVLSQLDKLQKVIIHLLDQKIKKDTFEILKAGSGPKGIYIVIKQKKNSALKLGDKLVLIDTNDGIIFGNFEVVDIRDSHCYSRALGGSLNSLFHGFIIDQKETSILPEMIAIIIPEEMINV